MEKKKPYNNIDNKIPTNKDDNQDNNLINELLSANEEQRLKNVELNLMLKKKESELEEKEKLLEIKNKKSEEIERQFNDIFNDLDKGNDLKESLLKLKNENEKLKNYLKIMDKSTSKSELRDLNNQLNVNLDKAKNEIINLKKKIEEIKNQKNKDFEEYKKNDYNEEYIDKELENFYDVIINIKSIAALEKEEGWPIKYNEPRKEAISKFKDEQLLKIGILGNGNVGKSFLLSRLFEMKIPSGYSVITEGLSLKYNEVDKYTILDSAGLQTPLLSDEKYEDKDEEKNKKKYEDLYKDKTQTENFIQNLIIYLSDMILIVVGNITFNEQKLINKIKKELEENEDQKDNRIYIIHNLMNFQTKSQVQKHIETNLMRSASFTIKDQPYVQVTKNKDNNKEDEKRYFFVEEGNKRLKVYHLIMAREKTEAGDYYNPFTYKVLREQFNTFTERKPLSIIEEVKNRFVDWSSDLLEDRIDSENIEIVMGDKEKEEKIRFKPSEKNNESIKLVPKACISNELGLNIYRSNGYEPTYYYYIENDEYLVVVLEAPGEVTIENKYADTSLNEIIVIGNKEDYLSTKKPISNNTKVGKFKMRIKYRNNISIADEDPVEGQETFEKGILQFKFKLIKKRQPGSTRDRKK